MSINAIPITAGTIPYPDVENNEIMHDYIFDGNNDALLRKINELITKFNLLTANLTATTDGDSGADNIKATSISGLIGSNVQTLLEAIHAEIIEVVVGSLPDASVTAAKLASDVNDFIDTYITSILSTQSEVLTGTDNDKLITPLSLRQGMIDNSSYMLFCTSTNSDILDVAFGKNNEDEIINIGKQLAMYAWYKGANKTSYPFTNLSLVSKYADIFTDSDAYSELLSDRNILELINLSTFAQSKLELAEDLEIEAIAALSGASDTFTTLELMFNDATATALIAASIDTVGYISNSAYSMSVAIQNPTFFSAICATPALRGAIIGGTNGFMLWSNTNSSRAFLDYGTVETGDLTWTSPYGGQSWRDGSALNGNTRGYYITIDLTNLVGKTINLTASGYYVNSSGSIFNSKMWSVTGNTVNGFTTSGAETKTCPITVGGVQTIKIWGDGGYNPGNMYLHRFIVA